MLPEVVRKYVRRARESVGYIAVSDRKTIEHIGLKLGSHDGGAVVGGAPCVDDDWERLVIDLDGAGCVLRLGSGVRDDQPDRLADIGDLFLLKHKRRAAVRSLRF